MEAPRIYADLLTDVTDVLDEMGKFLGRLVEAPATDGGHQLRLDSELNQFYSKYYELKRRHKEGSLSCAVLALTKSGTLKTFKNHA
jgi:hypothetical protein